MTTESELDTIRAARDTALRGQHAAEAVAQDARGELWSPTRLAAWRDFLAFRDEARRTSDEAVRRKRLDDAAAIAQTHRFGDRTDVLQARAAELQAAVTELQRRLTDAAAFNAELVDVLDKVVKSAGPAAFAAHREYARTLIERSRS